MKFYKIVLVFVAFLAFATPGYSLINPNFTPIHLVEQSDSIVVLQFKPPVVEGKVIAKIERTLKGKVIEKELTIDLVSGALKEQAKAVTGMINTVGKVPALLFIGAFIEEGAEEGGDWEGEGEDELEVKGLLHMAGNWLALYGSSKGVWELEKIDTHLASTWAGGTDMLLRSVEYILTDPDPDVPVSTGAAWSKYIKLGKVAGKVYAAQPVDLSGDGRLHLHIACSNGDRLFLYEKKSGKFKDVTEKWKLKSRSLRSVWCDYDNNKKNDLVSWDGKVLNLHLQSADGTFRSRPLKVTGDVKGLLGLSVVDCGVKGKLGLLVGRAGAPILLLPKGDGAMQAKKLAEDKLPVEKLGDGGSCLVADFDGDQIPDIIQLFSRGGFFYKGKALGDFAPPQLYQIGLGGGRAAAFLGDYDADGKLDIFSVAEDRSRIWHNLGKGKFVEMLGLSGEIAYISKPGGIGGMTGDINDDGRQDVLILYSDMAPQLFFNRGFRSFGHSHQLDLGENQLIPQAGDGQQAGGLADLNGDGAQDMTLVLKNGEVWVLLRDIGDVAVLSVRAVLPPGGNYAGPLTVTGWDGERPLGAWNVVAGSSEAFIARRWAGEVKLKWQFPNCKPQKKVLVLEEKPIRFLLQPKE